jgi:hypothetical protein
MSELTIASLEGFACFERDEELEDRGGVEVSMRLRHCPNCDGEVIVWDNELMADKCIDCGESWSVEEQLAVQDATFAWLERAQDGDGTEIDAEVYEEEA